MRIAEDWLREHGAYDDIIAWWREHGRIEGLDELMSAAAEVWEGHLACWLARKAKWTGVLRTSSYVIHLSNGLPDRENGPSVQRYNGDGVLVLEEYFHGGQLDREDGPAESWFNPDGSKRREEFWLRGKRASREAVMGGTKK